MEAPQSWPLAAERQVLGPGRRVSRSCRTSARAFSNTSSRVGSKRAAIWSACSRIARSASLSAWWVQKRYVP